MIEEIAKDLYRIALPLPEYYPESVNAYVIKDKKRNLIIDTGLQDDMCMHTIQADLSHLRIDLAKTDFFLTHGHEDHGGLVPMLIHAGSVVYINRLEADFIQGMKSEVFFQEIQEYLRMSGFPEGDSERIVTCIAKRNFLSKERLHFQFLQDGDALVRGSYRFICVETPGHNKGHTCLYEPDRKLLISGDHLLKDFIPAIPGRINNDNPLREYLLSLDKVRELDAKIALPGHGLPFNKVRQRIEEIRKHHHQQNLKVFSILREGGKSIYEITLKIIRKGNDGSTNASSFLQFFLISEGIFTHLRYLEEKGEIEKKMEEQMAIYSLCEIH